MTTEKTLAQLQAEEDALNAQLASVEARLATLKTLYDTEVTATKSSILALETAINAVLDEIAYYEAQLIAAGILF